MKRTLNAHSVSEASVTTWVERYLAAWGSNTETDIEALFTEDAEYHEHPYTTHWIGRGEIVAGWRSRWNWQQGGWTFDWSLDSLNSNIAVISGVGHYTELGDFDNRWTVAFRTPELCSDFHMVNTEITERLT